MAILLASQSCNISSDSINCNSTGPMVTQTQSVPRGINEIKTSSGLNVRYVQNDSMKITVTAPDDVIGFVKVTSDDNTLRFSTTKPLNGCASLVSITVQAPGVYEFDASSGSDITISYFTAGKAEFDASSGACINVSSISASAISVDVSSGAVITLAGECTAADFDASSGGCIEAAKLDATSGEAEASSGAVVNCAIRTLTGSHASSGGTIKNSPRR